MKYTMTIDDSTYVEAEREGAMWKFHLKKHKTSALKKDTIVHTVEEQHANLAFSAVLHRLFIESKLPMPDKMDFPFFG